MAIYDIAGLKVKMEQGGRTKRQAEKYLSPNQDENQKVDISISVDEKRINEAIEKHPELNESDWEYMLCGSDFYKGLIDYSGMLLHASCVVVDGYAYIFSADSGTGKSTHTNLWLKLFKGSYILNDDKPALRIIDNVVYACGTPFSGKYDISTPKLVPLAGICFLERSENNWIEKADIKDSVFKIFSQTVRNLPMDKMNKLFDVLEEIFKKVPLYNMGCNMEDEAAKLSFDTMKPKI